MKKIFKKLFSGEGSKRNKIITAVILVLLAIFATPVYKVLPAEAVEALVEFIFGAGGVSSAMSMALIGNIDQPSDRETAPNQIGFRLWLIATEQIDDTVPFPTPDEISRNIATIPLKTGEYMHHFDGVKDSLKYVSTSEKGDVTSTNNKTLMAIIAFINESLNFKEQYQGKGFILIYKECESDQFYLIGSYCKPVYLTNTEIKQDGDGKYITLTFGNDHWREPLNYVGSIIEQAPVTVPQNATDLAIQSGNNSYLLTDPSAANVAMVTASGFADADVGRKITITAPATNNYDITIPDNSVFVLRDGATWTAKPGSQLVLEIFDDSTLVEVDRIQTA